MMTPRDYCEFRDYQRNRYLPDPAWNRMILMKTGIAMIFMISCFAGFVLAIPAGFIVILMIDNLIDLGYFLVRSSTPVNFILGVVIAVIAATLPILTRKVRDRFQTWSDRRYYQKRGRFHGHTYAYYRGAPAEDQW